MQRGLEHIREASVLLACEMPDEENEEIYALAAADQKRILRKPDRAFCTVVSVQLLYQRLCILSVS